MVHLRNPRNQREIRHEGINIRPGIPGQDGGVGRHTVSPCTNKRRTTTNLKTKNNQNCQKTKLCVSMPTKELKKKYSSRPVGGAEMGSRGREDSRGRGGPVLAECGMNGAGSLSTSRPCGPTFAQINQEGRTQSGGEQGRQSSG